MKKEIVLYGLFMGLLLIVLRLVQYKMLIRDVKIELYATLVAILFLSLGIWFGRKFFIQPINGSSSKHISEKEQLSKVLNTEHDLSKREFEVLEMMAQGYTNQEIADKLYVSLNTIKTHTSNIYFKLEVKRRTQAVKKAREMQIL
ncbi:response regulator transcription factor [Chondrinema litorale]|uniref:response regulator transcription factor n=1 Tax=Chondrinema litorale TaxID=2994555 RepID=UPI00254344D7|nr:response regulator transcription factor [Chondrinema litorale]UZR98607.1 response regulator transcription factor [Chondrinema litorale]